MPRVALTTGALADNPKEITDVDSLPQTKVCSHCNTEKPIEEFYVHKRTGPMNPCKECHNARSRKNYRDNRERYKEHSRKYYKENREKIIERVHRWKKDNKERRAKWHAEYYQKNKERIRKYKRRWYLENRERLSKRRRELYLMHRKRNIRAAREWVHRNPERARNAKRRYKARRRNASGDHTPEEWVELCERFDERCVCCLEKVGIANLTADHIRPLSWGNSTNNIENIQPLCAPCNASKNDHHDTNYMADFHERLQDYVLE